MNNFKKYFEIIRIFIKLLKCGETNKKLETHFNPKSAALRGSHIDGIRNFQK